MAGSAIPPYISRFRRYRLLPLIQLSPRWSGSASARAGLLSIPAQCRHDVFMRRRIQVGNFHVYRVFY
jgi:hypothetical protein